MNSEEVKAYLTAARDEACSFFGAPISDKQWESSMPRALQKLERIIDRYGDEGGGRSQPYYLGKLVEEDIRERAFSAYTMIRCEELQAAEKEKSRRLSATTQINLPELYTASGCKVNAATE